MTIRDWLADAQLEEYAEAFESNDVTVETLGALSDEDLQAIGVKSLGHRRKIMQLAQGQAGTVEGGMNPALKGALVGFGVGALGMLVFMSGVSNFTTAGKAIWVILSGLLVSIPGAIVGGAAGRKS